MAIDLLLALNVAETLRDIESTQERWAAQTQG